MPYVHEWNGTDQTYNYTPGRGKIVPRNVNNSLAYKDSDYTFMIAIMHCPNCTILVLKLTSVVGYKRFCCAVGRHCSIAPFDVGCQYRLTKAPQRFSPHSRDCCRSLTLTCRNSPCWRSCEHCIKFLSSLRTPLPTRTWSSRDMCVNWNEPMQCVACATSELQLVASRLPGVRLNNYIIGRTWHQ